MTEDTELVVVLRAEDEASATVENVTAQFESLDRAAAGGLSDTTKAADEADKKIRGLGRGVGALASLLRATGNSGAADLLRIGHAATRVAGLLRGLQGASIGGLALPAGPAAPIAMAAIGGLAIGGLAAAALMNQGSKPPEKTIIINNQVAVDARGTITDHRALADEIARQAEARLTSRARLSGGGP